ncbi:MAG: exopolysaccharide biosynthesis protein [Aquimonas sp.]|nr:exopolysaccharide biosynthesis protein [Aquimonas sp.]
MHSHAPSTSQILNALVANPDSAPLDVAGLLDAFGRRAFGALLLLAVMPAFIPLPFGVGAISGPLVSLVGLQMLLGMRRPWLPARVRAHVLDREKLASFTRRAGGVLRWIERLCRPRLNGLATHPVAMAFCGAQLVLLGVLLALPIPLTNYPFGLLLVLYALALIERDGALLLIAWVIGIATIGASVLLSTEVIELLGAWLG